MAEVEPLILVVVDDRDFLFLTHSLLERSGFHVEVHATAPNWDQLLELDPASVLMDVMLDGEKGADVCRAIKAHKRRVRLPLILIFGQTEDRLKKEVDRYNADGFLTKPISKLLLMQLAAHYTQENRRKGGLHARDPSGGSTNRSRDPSSGAPLAHGPEAPPVHAAPMRMYARLNAKAQNVPNAPAEGRDVLSGNQRAKWVSGRTDDDVSHDEQERNV